MKSYLLACFLLVSLVLGAVAAVNLRANPFGVFNAAAVTSAELSRINQYPNMRFAKPWRMRELPQRSLVVGSSRAGEIRPAHPAWPTPGYNASVPGMTVRELDGFVRHAAAQGELERLTLVLDIEMFLLAAPETRTGYAAARMDSLRGTAETGWQRLGDHARALFASETLANSVAAGRATSRRVYRSDGSWASRQGDIRGMVGYLFLMQQRRGEPVASPARRAATLATLEELLRFCHQRGLDTRIAISPGHVVMLGYYEKLGILQGWRDVHGELVMLNARVAAEQGAQPFPLHGFNTLEGVVDEAIGRDQQASVPWFRDGVHFSEALGAIMLDSLWSSGHSRGVALDAQSLAAYLDATDTLVARFAASYPQQVSVLLESVSVQPADDLDQAVSE